MGPKWILAPIRAQTPGNGPAVAHQANELCAETLLRQCPKGIILHNFRACTPFSPLDDHTPHPRYDGNAGC
jgi:hypothetical protein